MRPAIEEAAQAGASSHDICKTIWVTRPDVRKVCDNDPVQLEFWLAVNGPREYGGLGPVYSPSPAALSLPSPIGRPDVRPALTAFMHFLWRSRVDLQQVFSLESRQGQQDFFWWYIFHGVPELGIAHLLTGEQKSFLAEPDPSVFQDSAPPITRLMMKAWHRDENLQRAFPLFTPEGRNAYRDWFPSHVTELLGPATRTESAARAHRVARSTSFGVNVIGFARGEFGIGEDARMANLSLRAANIPCSIYNLDTDSEVSQNDCSAESAIRNSLPYSTNLFCLTGIDMATLVARTGTTLLEGRRNIGLWPWELPRWPEDLAHAFKLVDEVWASSRYTFDSYVKSCPRPLRHVPMAVTIEKSEGLTRRDFGLPEHRFLFVFAFDALSSYVRKNPLASVRAFAKAFPRGDEPVGLVLKAMRAKHTHPGWQALLSETAKDDRITVLAETFTRARLHDLYRATDCLVSLHRAEGFGRNIAEAMMLGKPVIVTGYSGNLDFTTQSTAALVDYRYRPVTKEDYPFGAGQYWAEPDVDHAAWWMRRIAAGGKEVEKLSLRGREFVEFAHAPETVGNFYRSLLSM